MRVSETLLGDHTLGANASCVVALSIVRNLIGIAISVPSSLAESIDVVGSRWTLTEVVQALRVSKTLLSDGALGTNGDSVPALVVVEDLI